MIRKIFLVSALIALLPVHASPGNDATEPNSSTVPERLQSEWARFVEGLLIEVNPESQTIRIETREGRQIAFRYNSKTQVERVGDSVIDSFGSKNERRTRILVRTEGGSNMAKEIMFLSQT